MTSLSVNVNKLATLRNARGANAQPNLVAYTSMIIDLGVDGITVHPRPDGRHIRKQDVFDLKDLVEKKLPSHPTLELNIEGYPSREFMNLISEVRPTQCTLVPDPPDVMTSNAGWRPHSEEKLLRETIIDLKAWNVRSSLFIDPKDMDELQLNSLLNLRPDRIELYTEAFAKSVGHENEDKIISSYQTVAQFCELNAIGVNAGHDLNLENLGLFLTEVPQVKEVSIGHALVCEAILEGLPTVIHRYLEICDGSSRPPGTQR